MAILDRFRRNKNKSVLPEEVKQYYQNETKQKKGVAILLAIVALLATIALAAGLFFGGRFIYNKITGDDKKADETAQEGSGDFDKYVNEEQKAPTNQNQQGQSMQGQNLQGSQNPPAPAPAPSPQQTPKPTTPSTGDAPLPRTGDEGL